MIIAAAAALTVVISAGPAIAYGDDGSAVTISAPASHSYNGAWPVTITRSQRSNGTGCLTLNGTSHGGSASLVFGTQKYTNGSFIVINHVLVATLTEPLYGQNGALIFSAPAHRGNIGQGLFENIEGGSNFDAGAVAFGTKNDC
jgi:hypothetical protein